MCIVVMIIVQLYTNIQLLLSDIFYIRWVFIDSENTHYLTKLQDYIYIQLRCIIILYYNVEI